jgi:hypothetical protein
MFDCSAGRTDKGCRVVFSNMDFNLSHGDQS